MTPWIAMFGYLLSIILALALALLWLKPQLLLSAREQKNTREQKFSSQRSTLDLPDTPIWITTPDGSLKYCNPAFCELTDMESERMIGQQVALLQKHATFDSFLWQINTDPIQSAQSYEIWLTKKDDIHSQCYEIQSSVLANATIHIAHLVTHFKDKEHELIEADARMNEALKVTNIGVWEWDIEKDIWFATPSYFTMLGYSPVEGLADRQTELQKIHPEDRDHVLNTIKRVLRGDGSSYQYQCRIRHAQGDYRWVSVRCTVTEMNDDSRPSKMLGVRIDIDALKKTQQQLEWLAKHDSLTQLPNRSSLFDLFEESINAGVDKMALLFVDLDRFKNVNDTLGHRIGDQLLVEVANRMRSVIDENSFVVRQGGDEFIVLFPNSTPHEAEILATRLRKALSERYQLEQHQLNVTPSIGISVYPRDGRDLDTLYKRADTAMYSAKHNGRNRYAVFTQEMQAHSTRVLLIENALHTALENNEFSLHYQPQFSLKDQRLVAAEALIRWKSHSLGQVSPGEFIPIAEDSGQIVEIGEWVIRESIRQVREWIDAGYPELKVAINLSYAQFQEPDLPEFIDNILKVNQVPSKLLELELTERIAMDDPERAKEIINAFHLLGLETSIDDFGTGYSSLSYLQKLPVYKLKVDQSFVRNMINDENNLAIVSAIIALAKKLGMSTIAEGVETQKQLDTITRLGCDEVQGYLLGRPVPPAEFELNNLTKQPFNRQKIG